MLFQVLADIIVLIHFAFIILVAFGGLLVFRWRWIFWFHLPAVIWGMLIELAGWICPLTPLENLFRRKGGAAGYESSFVDHYILPLVYPDHLNRRMQIGLGLLVFIINLSIYGTVLIKTSARRSQICPQAPAENGFPS